MIASAQIPHFLIGKACPARVGEGKEAPSSSDQLRWTTQPLIRKRAPSYGVKSLDFRIKSRRAYMYK